MNQMQELTSIITDKSTPISKLNELLQTVKQQLSRYEQGLSALNKSDKWTYDIYQDVMKLGSGHNASITRSEWGEMLPDHTLRLRQITLNSLQEGQRSFQEIKSLIESELSKRSPIGEASSQSAQHERGDKELERITQGRQEPFIQNNSPQNISSSSRNTILAQQPSRTITASNKSPILASLLSFFLLGGAGQIYLGQWKKGLTLMISTFFLNFMFIGILIPIIGIGDAYGTAQKLSNENSVGEWEFNINWKVSGLVAIIYVIVICGIVFLASIGSSK